MTERELVEVLDAHDALVLACVRGELSVDDFEKAFESFYPHYAACLGAT